MTDEKHKITTAIIGAAGYAAGELARLILQHPYLRLRAVISNSAAGRKLAEVHPRLRGTTELQCTATLDSEVDIVFLCRGHGASATTLEALSLPDSTRVIDLSRDFRAGSDEAAGYLYGLPEALPVNSLHDQYSGRNIANPGCFASALLLACLPIVQSGSALEAFNITAVTGASGAGYAPRPTTHFPWRNDNLQVYNAFAHPHLPEVNAVLARAATSTAPRVNFVPMRGPFTRGILASVTVAADLSDTQLKDIYAHYYQDRPLIHLIDKQPDLSQVVHTNNCVLHVTAQDGLVHIVSVIDNLLKGAAGQAVQNANLLSRLPEECGLLAGSWENN